MLIRGQNNGLLVRGTGGAQFKDQRRGYSWRIVWRGNRKLRGIVYATFKGEGKVGVLSGPRGEKKKKLLKEGDHK